MSMKEAIRLLGTIVFFFGSLQGVTQSTASRSQEVASHFDLFADDFDLDGILIQLAVARRTSFLDHDRVNSVSH